MRILTKDDIRKARREGKTITYKDGGKVKPYVPKPVEAKKTTPEEDYANQMKSVAESLQNIARESNENNRQILMSMAELITKIGDRDIVIEMPAKEEKPWTVIDATVEDRDFKNFVKRVRLRRIK